MCFKLEIEKDNSESLKIVEYQTKTRLNWTFRKQITISFENDRFYKNNLRPFFTLPVTIINETTNLTNFIKKVFFERKNYM